MGVCEELLLGWEVHAVEAGVGDGRRRDAQVDRLCASSIDQANKLLCCGAADNRIVEHHDSLALENVLHGIELAENLEVAELLRWRYEAAANIGIAEKAKIHSARPSHFHALLIEAQRGVGCRLRDGNDDWSGLAVGHEGHGMLPRKLPPELSPYLCHKLTKDPGVRASKVDVFEDALRCAKLLRETQRRECASVYSRLVNNNHFARLHIANVLGLAQVECARLAGHAVAVGAVGAAASKLADAQGPESVGIADSTHEVVGHEDAREGPLGLGRRIEYLIELRVALRVGDEVKEQFRVDSRLHQHPLVLEEGLELVGVGEVAVVAESKVTHAVANGKGLETLNRILATSCTVARVADCVLPLEVLDVVVLEHVRHKPLPPAKLELGFLQESTKCENQKAMDARTNLASS